MREACGLTVDVTAVFEVTADVMTEVVTPACGMVLSIGGAGTRTMRTSATAPTATASAPPTSRGTPTQATHFDDSVNQR